MEKEGGTVSLEEMRGGGALTEAEQRGEAGIWKAAVTPVTSHLSNPAPT